MYTIIHYNVEYTYTVYEQGDCLYNCLKLSNTSYDTNNKVAHSSFRTGLNFFFNYCADKNRNRKELKLIWLQKWRTS